MASSSGMSGLQLPPGFNKMTLSTAAPGGGSSSTNGGGGAGGSNSGWSSGASSAAPSPKRASPGSTTAASRSLIASSSSAGGTTLSTSATGATPRAGRRSSANATTTAATTVGGKNGSRDVSISLEEVKEVPAAATATIEPRDEVLEDLLKTRLEDVALRSQKFAREIERLRAEARKREHDTTDMIKYLEQDVKRKEMDHKTLTKQVRDTHELYLQEKGMLKRHYEGLLKRQEGVFLVKEQQLLDKNKQLMEEVSDLSLFKKMRAELAAELESTKQTILQNERRHKAQLDDLERKFIEAKQRLEQEASDRIAHSRQVYKEEVGKELDMESKQVRKENREMAQELKFHEETNARFQKLNTRLQAEMDKQRMELSLAKERDDEYARRGVRQSKQIKELTSKVKTLERSLTQVLRDFELEREALDRTQRATVEQLEREVGRHQEGTKLQSRELTTIKKHATSIVAQRNEVEQLLLSCMEQVKHEIRSRRQVEYKNAKIEHARKTRELAKPRSGKLPALRAPEPLPEPDVPSRRVILADMSLEDRDRVLRLLFSKLHGTAFAADTSMPAHSFDMDNNITSISGYPSSSSAAATLTTIPSMMADSTSPPTISSSPAGPPLLMAPIGNSDAAPSSVLSSSAAATAAAPAASSSSGLTFLTDMHMDDVANRIGGNSST